MTKDDSILTKAQRLRVYCIAAALYADHVMKIEKNPKFFDTCLGMCKFIDIGKSRVGFSRAEINKKNFPEYFSYKPKQTWKKDGRFWWSTKTSLGTAKRRLNILNRLELDMLKGE
jgi:hypothetical protein